MTTATPASPSAAEVAAARLFARTCAAEWTRRWTVRSTWWFLAAAAVTMIGIGTIAGLDASSDPGPASGDPAWAAAAIPAFPGQFALLALALTAVTADYATGGIVPTLQWTPRRSVLFLARTLVATGTATAIGVLLALAGAVAAFTAAYPTLTLPVAEGLEVLGTVALVFATGTAFSVGLGFLLRSTAGGLVTVFLVMLVLPVLLPAFGYPWLTTLADGLPGSGAAFLLIGGGTNLTGSGARTVLLLWAAGALLLGGLRFARDDANR